VQGKIYWAFFIQLLN